MSMALRIKLSTMMLLQYAIWGIWVPNIAMHLEKLDGFKENPQTKISLIFMTMPIASIIAPFFGGQIADRYFAAQRFLGVSQIVSGVVLMFLAKMTSFPAVFIGMLVFNLLYAPTIALANSIVFNHWPNDKFSTIRVWGSIGWIAIGWIFGIWLGLPETLLGRKPEVGDLFYFAGVVSILYGLYSFTLPHTPPTAKGGNPWAFLDALALMKNPSFAVMAVIGFFVAIELQYYFVQTPSFLKQGMTLPESWVGPVQTFGQICEMVMMVLLPFVLAKTGFRITMAIGIAAWALRDFLFAVGHPTSLVVTAISLHGVGFAFFFTVIFMFADVVAPKDIRSSAQSFLSSVTIGMGMLVGSLVAGPIADALNKDWPKVYLIPAILCTVCCLVFLVAFKFKPATSAEASRPAFSGEDAK
ncbi:MAG: MFS transporter [Phycisphaerae bacterium]|nr:MFS transporter [Phycisphaerae bacterium]